jgi:hypothetical protein
MMEATPEQIGLFKAGAAQRYHERGVDPKSAQVLFDIHMSKAAEAMGITRPAVKAAAHALVAAVRAERKA